MQEEGWLPYISVSCSRRKGESRYTSLGGPGPEPELRTAHHGAKQRATPGVGNLKHSETFGPVGTVVTYILSPQKFRLTFKKTYETKIK